MYIYVLKIIISNLSIFYTNGYLRFTCRGLRLPELVASSGEICRSWGKGTKCPKNVYLDFT